MDNEHIIHELNKCTDDLLKVLSDFSDEAFSKTPFEGSWTAGQVAEHLLKSETDLPQMLTQRTHPAERTPDEKVLAIEAIFLNFDTKLQAPDFIIPSSGPHQKKKMMDSLEKVRNNITAVITTLDLSEICTGAEFPGLGHLTRWEWVNFVICHSKRHTNQLNKISKKLRMDF